MSMFTDYSDIETLRNRIKRDRPDKFFDENEQHHSNVHYGEAGGWEYADIGWCLPDDCVVVVEGPGTHSDDLDVAVPVALRIWLCRVGEDSPGHTTVMSNPKRKNKETGCQK